MQYFPYTQMFIDLCDNNLFIKICTEILVLF